ncbi:hypothetical protein MTR67_040700 [Solanum verrucosum]|uniref:Uncharacterized protein n=1 Tax=Solanum verrucosum TaxID=315347 RepID=A0AAF0ZRY4_SOLVR|nr:hypothetical protein MTR67_040700 [Solanum verrucosum]
MCLPWVDTIAGCERLKKFFKVVFIGHRCNKMSISLSKLVCNVKDMGCAPML